MDSVITIAATPETITWGYMDASPAPIARVKSGAEIVMETPNGEPPACSDERAVRSIAGALAHC
jgi:hypothetical protein